MSELKSYNSERIYWAVEQVEQKAGDIEDLHLDDNLFYIKSDVDKLIATQNDKLRHYQIMAALLETDAKEIAELRKACTDKDARYLHTLKENRHHKYKRCLAIADKCESEDNSLEAIVPYFDTDKVCWEYDSDYWYKWRERWLKIAEKFKEAK